MTGLTIDRAADAEALFASALAAQRQGRHHEAVRLLGQACQLGHVGAMTLLGGQLMWGRGVRPDLPAGLRLMAQAADLGGGEACSILARVLASGAAGRRDWERALAHLQRGAEAGDPDCRDQLRLLADPTGAPSRLTWAQLRRRVDLDAWRAPPPLRALSEDPEVRAGEGFVARAVCDWIIRRAKDRLTPAPVMADAVAGEVRAGVRTNSLAGFSLMVSDLVVQALRERLAAAAGVDVGCLEAPQALHYAPGEEYVPHFDFMDPELPEHARSLARGQRSLTLLVYLNQGYQGGETDFPRLGLRHKGRTGGLLMFRNLTADGRPDRRMLHAGLPPASGEKWLLSQWIRDRAQP